MSKSLDLDEYALGQFAKALRRLNESPVAVRGTIERDNVIAAVGFDDDGGEHYIISFESTNE